jgi:geranylgeranyl diphosphate synthase type I
MRWVYSKTSKSVDERSGGDPMTSTPVRAETDISAGDVLRRTRSLVEPALRRAVDSLPGNLRLISGYHLGWWDADGAAVPIPGGKAIRPALTVLSARVCADDPEATEAAVAPAVAIELVHNFSLLHDDVMDGDTTRRHRPTAWTVYGIGPAILAGDALLNLASEVLADSNAPSAGTASRMLSAAVLELIDGQSADLSFEKRTDVSPAECVRMAERKTGALLGCACALGGLFAGADNGRVDHLRGFGSALGLAFQIVDDLLGIWGNPERTGKPVFADLRRRKKSLPVVAALTGESGPANELAELYALPRALTDEELRTAADLVERAGGRAWATDRATGLAQVAAEHLQQVVTPAPTGDLPTRRRARALAELEIVARLLARRDH